MTDTIGPVSLQRVFGFTENGKAFTLAGDMASEDMIKVLEELLLDADLGTAIHRIRAGPTRGEDMTHNHDYTQLCLFDDESMKDGWYLIRTSLRRGVSGPNFYEYTFGLFYMGSQVQYKWGLEVRALSTTTNDWGK